MRCCISPALLLVACLLAGCDKPPAPPAQAKTARVHFSCDVSGRIEPCGCFTGQLGGLTRLKVLLDSDPRPSLRVDVGDAIAGSEDYHVIQYRHVLKAFHQLGYQAVNAGRREAALDLTTLAALAKDSPVSMLSANLLDAKTLAPVLRPWVATEVDGVRYGLIGIVDPSSLGEGNLGAGLTAADPASVISALLPEVKRAADVIVLIAFATEDRMKELAAQFFELHLILGGDVTQPSQELVHANRSLLLATTNQGRAIGFIQAGLEESKLVKPTHAILMLGENMPEAASIIAMAGAYRAEVRQAKLAVDDPMRVGVNDVPGVRQTSEFAGSEACATCHASEFVIWSKSTHAQAWKDLVRRESDADPTCIGCHSIGFGSPSGYRREFAGHKLVNVGCESCHGPGSKHIADRTSGKLPTFQFRPLGAGDCTACHHGEFSRPFEYDEFWKLIAHGRAK